MVLLNDQKRLVLQILKKLVLQILNKWFYKIYKIPSNICVIIIGTCKMLLLGETGFHVLFSLSMQNNSVQILACHHRMFWETIRKDWPKGNDIVEHLHVGGSSKLHGKLVDSITCPNWVRVTVHKTWAKKCNFILFCC